MCCFITRDRCCVQHATAQKPATSGVRQPDLIYRKSSALSPQLCLLKMGGSHHRYHQSEKTEAIILLVMQETRALCYTSNRISVHDTMARKQQMPTHMKIMEAFAQEKMLSLCKLQVLAVYSLQVTDLSLLYIQPIFSWFPVSIYMLFTP